MKNKEDTLTVKEVSALLKCNVLSIYKLIKDGLLPAVKLDTIKVRKAALENFLGEQKELHTISTFQN